MPTLREKIKEYRTRQHLTQKALAEKAGISLPYIEALERGVRKAVAYKTARKLAEVFGTDPEFWLPDNQVTQPADLPTGQSKATRHFTPERPFPSAKQVTSPRPSAAGFPAPGPSGILACSIIPLIKLPSDRALAVNQYFIDNQIVDYLALPLRFIRSVLNPETLFGLKVDEEDLTAQGIAKGDTLVLERDSMFLQGKLYLIQSEKYIAIRRLFRVDNRMKVESTDGTSREQPSENIRILGRVVLSLRWEEF